MNMKGFEGQSPEYRKTRDELLEMETALKDQRERVAAFRRKLPLGPPVPEDYVFEEKWPDGSVARVKLSELFASGVDSLILIHMMWAEANDEGCPMCSMWADGYDAVAHHVRERTNLALVAKKNIESLNAWGRGRGWQQLRLLSSRNNTFNVDIGAENADASQNPGISVFVRASDGTIHHSYSIEAGLTRMVDGDGFEYRGIDLMSPVWHMFDLLPEGRGDWLPSNPD